MGEPWLVDRLTHYTRSGNFGNQAFRRHGRTILNILFWVPAAHHTLEFVSAGAQRLAVKVECSEWDADGIAHRFSNTEGCCLIQLERQQTKATRRHPERCNFQHLETKQRSDPLLHSPVRCRIRCYELGYREVWLDETAI